MIGRWSLRTRLAVLYALLAVFVLAISLVTVYEVAHREALNRLDTSLRADARTLATRAEGSETSEQQTRAEHAIRARELLSSGHLLAVLDGGRVVASNADARTLVNEAGRQGLLAGSSRIVTVDLPGGSVRVAVVPMDSGEYAIAAGPLRPTRESMEALLNATLIAGGIGVALTFVGAWFATRRGLRPLESITALANDVAPDALDLRTGLQARDEIGAVAAAIDRMLHRLEAGFETQNQFMQDASHELRTPLTIARGHLELLAESPDASTEERDEAITVAMAEIDRMSRLVDGLLQLARASEVERLQLAPIVVEPLLESIVAQLQRLDERAWLVHAEGNPAVFADEDALRQIVLNLARNADQHSPPEAAIELTAAAGDGAVTIEIADRGAGIPPRLRAHAFERFAHDGDGLGLGLAISQALAEAQAGSIALHDRPGGGTVATVTLPTTPARPSPSKGARPPIAAP